MYDIAIIGLGVSGGLLLNELIKQTGDKYSIVVFDTPQSFKTNRFISFWSKEDFPFPNVKHKSWSKVNIRN